MISSFIYPLSIRWLSVTYHFAIQSFLSIHSRFSALVILFLPIIHSGSKNEIHISYLNEYTNQWKCPYICLKWPLLYIVNCAYCAVTLFKLPLKKGHSAQTFELPITAPAICYNKASEIILRTTDGIYNCTYWLGNFKDSAFFRKKCLLFSDPFPVSISGLFSGMIAEKI